MKNIQLYSLFLILGFSLNCQAQDFSQKDPTKNKNFIGIGINNSSIHIDSEENNTNTLQSFAEKTKKFWNVYTGYQLNDNFSVRIGYGKLADAKGIESGTPNIKIKAITLSGMGFYPLAHKTSLLGEVGLYNYHMKQTYEDNSLSNRESGVKPFWGAGIKYDLGKNTDLILKYNNYGKIRTDNYQSSINQVALNMEYKF